MRPGSIFRLLPEVGKNSDAKAVFVFTCYLDDSDNHSGPSMGISGYLAHRNRWIDFELEVEPFLQSRGVAVLRGKDFHHGTGDFKNWTGIQKRAFVEELYSIAGKYVISGINSTVNKKDYKKLRIHDKKFSNMSPLGIAFVSAVQAVLYKDNLSQLNDGFEVSFFVELGNKNNGNIERYFKWLKDEPVVGERLGALALVSKRDCRAIQLADFLAFHGRREADQWANEGYTEKSSKGAAMQIMVRHIYHRHNRLYDNGSGVILVDPFQVPDGAAGLILPPNGIP